MHRSATSKLPQPELLKDWYPYYAGYPSSFVGNAIDRYFSDATSILDPWNGSGTTTAAAAVKGIAATGTDLNPAVTIVARGRLTPKSICDSLGPVALQILRAASAEAPPLRHHEPLAEWLRAPAWSRLRQIQHAIHRVTASDDDLELALAHEPATSSSALGLLPSFYYTALFATARDLLKPFRASNPTWLKYPISYRNRVSPSPRRIDEVFVERVACLADRLMVPTKEAAASPRLHTGSVLDLDAEDEFDVCLTSPPYATRIDYVRSNLAELAVLGLPEENVAELRRQMTGTPVVKGVAKRDSDVISDRASRVSELVKNHQSHGSANYYGPWLQNYFCDLQSSLARIETAVASTGSIGIVVQDSHYKDVHIDLQDIVIGMMSDHGRPLRSRTDFPVSRSIASMHPGAADHKDRRYCESLLVFSQ